MTSEEIIDKIIRGEPLTESEQSWWRANRENSEIKDAVNFLQQMDDPLRLEHRKLLKSQLQTFEKNDRTSTSQIPSRTSNINIIIKKWLSIAAALALIIAIKLVFFKNDETRYFAEYFEPYPSIVNPVLKGGEISDDPFNLAMAEYQNLRYTEAMKYFDQSNMENDTVHFYQANAMLALGMNEEARTIFHQLRDHENRFTQESAWYEVLALLKLKRIEEAQPILVNIVKKQTHPYFDEATDLLKKIQ